MWTRSLNRALLVVAVCGPLATRGWAQDRAAPEGAEALIQNLRAENVDVRRAAAAKLRFSSKEAQLKALPLLIELLEKEKDGQVRLAVLDTVTVLGPDAAPAVSALVHTLKTDYGGQGKEELHQDYRAALALAAIGKPAVEALHGLLKERKESVRAEVVMGLGRIGPDAGIAVPDLAVMLGDKSERIRREASLALGHIGKASIGPLIEAAASPNEVIRARAMDSFGCFLIPTDEVRAAVIKGASDASSMVRAAAVKALARLALDDEVLISILDENLRQKDEPVRLAAVNFIVERRELLPKMSPHLIKLLAGNDDGVARHAAYLLGMIGPHSAPELLKALGEKETRVDQIAAALAHIGRPILELLTQSLQAPEPRVRQAAALALGQIRPLAPGTAQKLALGLADPDREVKTAFLTAIGNLGRRAGECVPAVRSMLHDDSADVRLKAVEILAQSAPRNEQLLGDLTSLLNDSDGRVQCRAIDIVRSLGPLGRKALPEVIAKLSSAVPEVRLAAAEMIGSHGQAAVEAVPGLSSLLEDASPRIRTTAAQTLGKLGKVSQPAFPRLTPLLEAEQPEVREAAALALGSLELDPEALRPPLSKALHDKKLEVRRAAMRSIQRLGPQGSIFVPDIILLAEDKQNLRSVERLLRRFERSGPDARSVPELVKQLDHKQDSVRLLAIKFIGLAGRSAQDAIPALEKMREHPSAEVRKQAEAACEQIKNKSASGSAS